MIAPAPIINRAPTEPFAPTVKQRTEMRICSVYPVRKTAIRRHSTIKRLAHNKPDGSPAYGLTCDTEYVIEAAPRDGYSILAVFDALQAMTGWSQDGPKENTLSPGHIPVDVVANDLVNTWAAQTIASKDGYKPGIGIIAGELPTEEELAKLREQQRAFFEFLVQCANDMHIGQESKNITNIHRHSAHWLLGEAAQQLPWYPKMEQRSVKNCPRCARQILSAALGCEHCSLDLIAWYERFTHLTPDPAVAQFLVAVPQKAPDPRNETAHIINARLAEELESLKKNKEPLLAGGK